MTLDRKQFLNGMEAPPPYSGDTKLWAEDIDNYLRRRMQRLEDEIGRLIARVEALEPTETEASNGSDEPTQGSSEG